MRAFGKTDIGKMRDMNQDYYYISNNDKNYGLYILADGMGGYEGGEIASKLATESVIEYINNKFEEYNKKENILKLINEAIEYANTKIYEKSQETEELEEMGTTLEVCLIIDDDIYIGHIGDSRIYTVQNNKLTKLTTDHSYVEQLVKDGTITREEAATHPKKNMLIKALGCLGKAKPDVFKEKLNLNDTIFICSDGLTNMVKDEEIESILNEEIENKAEKLIEKANNAGGYDNITTIIIENK